jgi:hypothetical protein
MSNNLRVGQWRAQSRFGKHVCIFDLERKGAVFTAEVVCRVCGVYLSSQQDRPQGASKAAQPSENQRDL